MSANNNLQYIKHQDINSGKWNNCIESASNCRIYAYDWYLDRTAVIWDALVYGNYEFVMPLPFRKKWGIKYLYQPLFSQQLGIFPTPPSDISTLFYNELIKKFRYSDFQLNAENQSIENLNPVRFLKRKNFLLPLQANYSIISSNFSKNTKRNLAKAYKNRLNVVPGIRLEEYLKFKKKNITVKINKDQFNSLKSIIALGQYKGFGEIYGVYTSENELCAAVYFCRWKNRVIYLNAATSKQGKELGGMYLLLNNFIERYAGNNVFLDFEGSMIPGVQRFYSGFGAIQETYFQLKFNRLPLPLKWIKRN